MRRHGSTFDDLKLESPAALPQKTDRYLASALPPVVRNGLPFRSSKNSEHNLRKGNALAHLNR
jgi:hypothetical protein